ncbi:hypothetical protein V6N13_085823 [Hibiscus sabdariffa]|uniref:RNase H type-1 domain-containing protein n=1 Tax=Hibiscus sabdariffa TaxID=183260 RepID=A0ABR2FS10_9ROSI
MASTFEQAALLSSIHPVVDAVYAEAYACVRALTLATVSGHRHVEIEGDSQTAVSKMVDSSLDLSVVRPIIAAEQRLIPKWPSLLVHIK